jgi:hypothetical protein
MLSVRIKSSVVIIQYNKPIWGCSTRENDLIHSTQEKNIIQIHSMNFDEIWNEKASV